MSLNGPPLVLSATLLLASCCVCSTTFSDDRPPSQSQQDRSWTLDEALEQIALYPHDAYLQYVALQLARRQGKHELQRVAQRIWSLNQGQRQWGPVGRSEQVDLFNLATGALAVQESLQMDAMTAELNFGEWQMQPAIGRGGIFNGSTADGNKLQQLATAMSDYDAGFRRFPAVANYNAQGQPLLSWRVHLLPFLGHEDLYKQFHIDEPWDSPHNRELISKMPDAYKASSDVADGQYKTRYLVPIGERTLFPGSKPVTHSQIADGTANTILIVEVGKQRAVVWTKPDDIQLDLNAPLKAIGGPEPSWLNVVMASGRPISVPTTADPELQRQLFVRNDEQRIDWQAVYADCPPWPNIREPAVIEIGTIDGPTIRSHPFEEMLADRKPSFSQLAAAVPEDFYYIRFRSFSKLLGLAESSNLWSTQLFSQSTQDAYSHDVVERLQSQLCIETSDRLQPFYDDVVQEVALTGSDLFLQEGSDVTLLFHYDQNDAFQTQMDGFLANAAKSHPAASRTSGSYQGVDFVHLSAPDRQVHVFSAYPGKGLHIRSNSRTAFERIIDTLKGTAGGNGKTGASKPLAEAFEFQYMRTLYEMDGPQEDGFIYLSDSFIRELVGPVKKITELRRVLCYNQLRMLGHAAMLYRTEHGHAPESLQQLKSSKCLPEEFGIGRHACSDGGHYQLADDGAVGVCSVHGRAGQMTPCCEIPVQRITADEQTLYDQFLEDYNEYWRTYFDPIGIRVHTAPTHYRVETIVLPLIDNSIYTAMSQMLGGTPQPLDELPVPKRNIFSMALKINKDTLIAAEAGAVRGSDLNNLRMIVLAMHNYESAYMQFPPQNRADTKLSWRVHILPFLDHNSLYDEFHLNEPWDSPHNIKLLDKMPSFYGKEGTNTRIVGFSGEGTPLGKPGGLEFGEVIDGTSNTIFLVEAGPDKAVPWTRPLDLPFDADNPIAALGDIPDEGFKAAFMDGSAHLLPKDIDAERLKALLTYNGREETGFPPSSPQEEPIGPIIQSAAIEDMFSAMGATDEEVQALEVADFLNTGIGDQIGFHVYDAEPTFAMSISQFVGQALSDQRGMNEEFLVIVPIVSSLNSPVYLTIQVQDEQIVDRFLNRLDPILAKVARRQFEDGFISFGTDYYHLPSSGKSTRCFAFQLGGFRFRIFVARVGKALVLATQPVIIEDLIKQSSAALQQAESDSDATAHLLVRFRPENWQRVLSDYRLGWAESNRESCLKNLGPLTGIARAYGGSATQTLDVAQELYGIRYYCPEGGHYDTTIEGGNGSVGVSHPQCSIHGSAAAPRQAESPVGDSQLDRMRKEFTGMTAALTFTEEGLRAVLRIDRTPPSRE